MGGFRAAAIVGVLGLVLVGGTALANHSGHEFDTAEQCIQSGDVFNMPRCSRSGNGPWVAQYPGDPSPGIPGGGFFATFLVFALLWSTIPAIAGGMIASSRGQSVGIAVLLGIALGWIGLLIVVLAFKPEVTTAARNVIGAAANRDGWSPPPPPRRDTTSRLQELERLKREGLVTDAEYASRRERILNDL